MTIEEIPFLVSLPDEEDQEVKGLFSRNSDIGIAQIPVDRLKENLSRVCQGLATALNDVKKVGNFKLKEVTIGVEVTVEGGVNFVGTANVEGKGAITLTFAEE